MRKLLSVLTFCLAFPAGSYGQSIADIEASQNQYGKFIPGIACKTRTNNEATVRNLAKGVWNRDSASPVALNCGWNTSWAWTGDEQFANNARIDGDIAAIWVRTDGTPTSQANDAFCAITAAGMDIVTSPPSVSGTEIGTVSPSFSGGPGDEISSDAVATDGLVYPPGTGEGYAANTSFSETFFSAFCRVPQGVRLQGFVEDPDIVGSHP